MQRGQDDDAVVCVCVCVCVSPLCSVKAVIGSPCRPSDGGVSAVLPVRPDHVLRGLRRFPRLPGRRRDDPLSLQVSVRHIWDA